MRAIDQWLKISMKKNAEGVEESATIDVFDEIGFWGVQAKDFHEQVQAITAPKIKLNINSPGGSAFDSVAMYNSLRMTGKPIEATCMGIAASAASLLFMAGDKRIMPKNTMLMVHNPSMFAWGNSEALRETADILDKVSMAIDTTYATRSGMKIEDVKALLSKDTFLTADECIANGLATETTAEINATAHFDPIGLPKEVTDMFEASRIKMKAPVVDPVVKNDPVKLTFEPTHPEMVHDVLVTADLAEFEDVFMLDEKLVTREQVVAAATEAREIKALCVFAKKPDDAAKHIHARTSLADVRSALRKERVTADEESNISNIRQVQKKEEPAAHQPGAPEAFNVDATKIYAAYDGRK